MIGSSWAPVLMLRPAYMVSPHREFVFVVSFVSSPMYVSERECSYSVRYSTQVTAIDSSDS